MKRINDTAAALALTGLIFALTCFSESAKAGAQNGITMCEGIIIPSLLPVLILTNLILKSRASRFFETLFGRVFSAVFRLPRCAVIPVVFGLVGGFPAGAVLTSEQYKSGGISDDCARRIMRFNFSGGVAFTITAVGGYYGSAKTGTVLYIINIISSLIIAGVSSLFAKKEKSATIKSTALPFSDALCRSAETASKSIILMSAYIILFSALVKLLPVPRWIYPLFEITGGIFSGAKLPLPYCAAFLAFGGLCIHLQLIGMLREMKVRYFEFLIFRILSAVISFALCKVYLLIFPQSAEVFGSASAALPYQFTEVNAALGIITMLGCAAIVLDIENRKIKL